MGFASGVKLFEFSGSFQEPLRLFSDTAWHKNSSVGERRHGKGVYQHSRRVQPFAWVFFFSLVAFGFCNKIKKTIFDYCNAIQFLILDFCNVINYFVFLIS